MIKVGNSMVSSNPQDEHFTTPNQVILHDPEQSKWFKFQHPVEVIQAFEHESVLSSLKKVEDAVNEHNLHAAGFLSYESAPGFDAALKVKMRQVNTPLLWFGLYEYAETMILPNAEDSISLNEWESDVDEAEYFEIISNIKTHIAEGNTYQVNYTFRLRSAFSGDPWQLFLRLVAAQNGGFSAYVEMEDLAICSVSPELFFRLSGETLVSRPMKGTAPRGKTLDDDAALADWLKHSKKNLAENVMIVDMLRNDMGKVAEVGTVKVSDLYKIERYPSVLQMTSTVTSETKASVVGILSALFPCASITGAPKASTMNIISELEKSPRGVYTGSVGYIAPNREAQFNVAIRTVVVNKKMSEAEYGVGGGIVWDSDSKEEYEECRIKADVLMKQRPIFDLLESILWEADAGYFLLDKHLHRMTASAEYFNIPFDPIKLNHKLMQFEKNAGNESQKVRVQLSQAGVISIEAIPISKIPLPDTLNVKLAEQPVDSSDVFLYHKTTHRGVYDAAINSQPNCDDVLLWNEQGLLTESTKANLVCQFDDGLFTPSVTSGLLAGTYREQLLEEGMIQERTIKVDELWECGEIFLINSVRRWMKVELNHFIQQK